MSKIKKNSKQNKRSKKIMYLENAVGWYGAFATLTAYLLISANVLHGKDLSYQLLNLTGALGLATICYFKKTYQPLFVNIIWAIIAISAIIYIVNVLH